ncbi:cytochrome P450 [Longimycelium tulufanense]|uniref:Cytochrome P450 n=2 Tax=Longimycelium tulufanense TaxID=907463 RepID=A0A8J3C9G4_9PSEU|nr:cytochrome P450 [Longimycelium tulufanense]
MLRQPLRFMSSLQDRGSVVRISLGTVPVYVLTTPELLHQVLVSDAERFEKGIFFQRMRPFLGNGLVLSSGEFYRRQRRLVQPAFHRTRIARYSETMSRVARELVDSWHPGQVVDVDKRMQDLTISVAGQTLFSADLGSEVVREIERSVPILLKDGTIRALTPKFLEKLPLPGNRRFDEAISRVRRVVSDVVESAREGDTDRGDLLSTLIFSRDKETGEGMSDRQVLDEVITLLIAGTQTSALALSWFFYEIARHPGVERRLHAEVDDVVGPGPEVTFDDVSALTYTHQVANEILRKYSAWLLMRRSTADVSLDGIDLPAGSELAFSPYAFHHDPRFFRDPERFDPDRWAPDRVTEVPRDTFLPFGSGMHHCPGHHFAHAEIAITVATVASRHRLVPVPGRTVRPNVTAGMPYPSQLPMTVVPRRA